MTKSLRFVSWHLLRWPLFNRASRQYFSQASLVYPLHYNDLWPPLFTGSVKLHQCPCGKQDIILQAVKSINLKGRAHWLCVVSVWGWEPSGHFWFVAVISGMSALSAHRFKPHGKSLRYLWATGGNTSALSTLKHQHNGLISALVHSEKPFALRNINLTVKLTTSFFLFSWVT